ncbi:hypothetical protein GPL15_02245 [Clostridium sp. MCC353]|uniref:Bug family tripartite tricarboxylate transporter substrate binding protein n=1 Tax=Clostridium sp. MCC353 TaxID=2592646 RepID=UPI001C03755C|nr:tripartite tricarboxylate transporter substrate binding protein [Clostridium sp. MCC353]MBT9775330.1 hypothetical protein [Clostridium sp. MCC353]
MRKTSILCMALAVSAVLMAGCGSSKTEQAPAAKTEQTQKAEEAKKAEETQKAEETKKAEETAAVSQASAEEKKLPDGYPKKPIKIIVPWDAGGGTDVFVRTIATGAEKYLGQPLNIVNRGGAGGTIATTEFLKEKGDGYSIIFEAIGVFSTQPKMNAVTYKAEDFKPVIGTTVDPIMLVTTTQTGIKTFDEFKEYAKNNTVNFGFTGSGSLHEIANYALFGELDADVNGINYTGGGELLAAMMGNHVQFGSLHPVNIMSYEDADTFVPLLVYSNERIAQYPDVPTAKEMGYNFDFEVWKFIAAPKDTPDEIIDYLYDGFDKILKDPEIKKLLEEGGSVMMDHNTPEEVEEKLLSNVEQTGKILDELGLSQN